MNANNIVAAPQAEEIDGLYDIWHRTHVGSRDTFYRFLTTPSAEREAFISSVNIKYGHNDGVETITLTIA